MEDVVIPTTGIPAELKAATEQTLKRANELKKADPVVSYWCCFWAAQKALKVPNRSKEGTMFLMQVLDALEAMKVVLASNEAVTNDAAGAAYMENFALRVFLGADNEDRAGKSSKATVQKFMVASQFIDVLKAFEGGPGEEMEQKYKYSKWKAADIAKALREGRTPVAGPPVAEEDEAAAFPSLAALASPTDTTHVEAPGSPGSASRSPKPSSYTSPSGGSRRDSGSGIDRPNLPPLSPPTTTPFLPTPPVDPTDTSSAQSQSGAWSTIATPGVGDSDDGKLEAKDELPGEPLEPKDSTPKLPSQALERSGSQSSGKSVRFMGPDGAPLSPGGTTSTVDVFDEPLAPPPSDISGAGPSVSLPSPPAALRSPPQPTAPPLSPPKPPTAFPSAPPPSATSSLGLAPAPTAPPVIAASGVPRTLNMRESDQFKKHCRFAISAMDYDDTDTARKELLKALAMLS